MKRYAVIALIFCLPARAETLDPGLLTCRVIVTGTDVRSRPGGFARCVRDVVVKVTGKAGLGDDPRVVAMGERAEGLIEDFAYLDRMTDIPTHDEQGTRDRPFDLVGHVDGGKLLAALGEMGVKAWVGRPVVMARVAVVNGRQKFVLSGDGDLGERQRQALLAAAEVFGVRVALPTVAQVEAGSPARAGVVVLDGSLTWSDADFGWNAAWRVGERGWGVRGVSFDAAYRSGVGGLAGALSGP